MAGSMSRFLARAVGQARLAALAVAGAMAASAAAADSTGVALVIGTDRSDVQSAEVRRTRGQCNVGKAIVPDVQGEF